MGSRHVEAIFHHPLILSRAQRVSKDLFAAANLRIVL
jgi:hypothetical protein